MGNHISSKEEQERQQHRIACGAFSLWKGSGRKKSLLIRMEGDQEYQGGAGDDDENDDDCASATQMSQTTRSSDDCSLWDPYNTRRSSPQQQQQQSKQQSSSSSSSSSAGLTTLRGSWISFSSFHQADPSASVSTESNSNNSINSKIFGRSHSSPLRSITDYTAEELLLSDTEATPASDLTLQRQVWIVTTAALPWMTGTAVNPLLRAAYLAQKQRDSSSTATADVHLVLPWLEDPQDRVALYGSIFGNNWNSCDQQEAYIQQWLTDNVDDYNAHLVQIHWYPARYHAKLGSIFAMGDVCDRLDPVDNDAICILEEPEHLNYYRGGHWRTKFQHVAGVIHTNYCQYAEQHSNSDAMGKLLAAPLVGAISAWMVRAYCDKVIQLSATLPEHAPEKEVVCNVHGVRPEFLDQDYCNSPASTASTSDPDGPAQIYFLGKLLWAKGLDKLLQLQQHCKKSSGQYFAMDIFGSGPEQDEIQQAFRVGYCTRLRRGSSGSNLSSSASGFGNNSRNNSSRLTYSEMAAAYWRGESKEDLSVSEDPLPVQFLGRMDHAKLDQGRKERGQGCYKIFVNPSVSEVLCTVTAEAIAMGKFVIIPFHPSNTFFEQFPNCLQYNTDDEFLQQLEYALQHEPQPLGPTSRDALTWQGATERLCRAVAISHREAARRDRLRSRDQRLADLHIKMGTGTTGDVLRHVLGGGPVAKQSKYGSSGSLSMSRSSSRGGDVSDAVSATTSTASTAVAIPLQAC